MDDEYDAERLERLNNESEALDSQRLWDIHKTQNHGLYNLGGGKENSCSILESFRMIEEITAMMTTIAQISVPTSCRSIYFVGGGGGGDWLVSPEPSCGPPIEERISVSA